MAHRLRSASASVPWQLATQRYRSASAASSRIDESRFLISSLRELGSPDLSLLPSRMS